METERWRQISRLFQAATELSPEERRVFLEAACRHDNALQQEVESLLTHASTSSPYPPVAAPGLTPGQLLAGRYRVVAFLGRGGMGEVYRADDLQLGQPIVGR